MVVVCASGSAIVFRNDIYDWLEAGGKSSSYKAALYHWLSWLGNLHGSLLMDTEGMTANAIAGFLVAALCLTGLVVWWPGASGWRRALGVRANVGWKRFAFDLHSVVGFWTFAVLLMWGVTGGYFVFPQPFRATINFFTPINAPTVIQPGLQNPAASTTYPEPNYPVGPRGRRPLTRGARILRGFSYAHYGNFAGWSVKALWVILGLAPAVLFLTALLMWSNRVVAPTIRRWRKLVRPRY